MLMYHRIPSVARVLTWSSLDAFITQTAVLVYEYILLYTMGAEFHGVFGNAMSFLYVTQAVTNFGFDSNIAPFSNNVVAHRWNFIKFVVGAWIPHLAWVACIAVYLYIDGLVSVLGMQFVSAFLPWILVFAFESIRKTAKHLLRYIGYIQEATIIEVVGTLAYLAAAGLGLAAQYASLSLLLTLHAAAAAAQTVCMAWYIIQHTIQLPTTGPRESLFSIVWMHIHRIYVGINEVAGTLYTGQFLTPLVAYSRGYAFASVFRLASSTAQWLVRQTQQIFVTTSSITLAHHKSRPIEERRRVFYTLTHYLHQIVYAVIFFVLINSRWLFVPDAVITFTPLQALGIGFFLFALTVVDSFCAFYLRWYIVEEQAYSIAIFNLISIAGMQLIAQLIDFDDMLIIVAMFAFRALAFIMISAWSAYIWGIKPSLKWEKESIIVTIIISALWFMIHAWQYATYTIN